MFYIKLVVTYNSFLVSQLYTNRKNITENNNAIRKCLME